MFHSRARAADHIQLVPSGLRRAFTRVGMRVLGGGLIALAAVLGWALYDYSPTHPSLNTATTHPTLTLLGAPGAIVADVLIQSFGLGAAGLVLIIVAWGGCFLAGGAVTWMWLRLMAGLSSLFLWGFVLAWSPRPAMWTLETDPGGAVGRLLLTYVERVFLEQPQAPFWIWGCAAVGILLGGALFLWATCIRVHHITSACAAFFQGVRTCILAGQSVGRAIQSLLRARPRFSDEPSVRVQDRQDVTYQNDISPYDTPSSTRVAVETPHVSVDEVSHTEPRSSRRPRGGPKALPSPHVGGETSVAMPSLDLLFSSSEKEIRHDKAALSASARRLEETLKDFGVKGEIIDIKPGPVVTLYALSPAPGTKTSRVIGLADDIARSMSALSVRIAVVPGQSTIGIELPNAVRETVNFRSLLGEEAMGPFAGGLVLALGRDIGGTPVHVDLARMPHVLIAGTTGSGKSVAVNTMICSLLFHRSPEQVRFIMIDPKMLELSVYDAIPHLLTPVVTDPGKAVVALKWAVREMEDRYRAMSQLGVRNITGYNQRLREATGQGEILTRTVQVGFEPETGQPVFEEQELDMAPLPYIVIVVDEMADLMLVAGKDVEATIQRLAQMARAAGIHLIMATQRPSVDVITGTIKANFPTRISFQVTSKIDSRTILGEQGAEQLLGQGDMLYMAAGGRITRVHGPFISDTEVEGVASFLRACGTPEYIQSVTEDDDNDATVPSPNGVGGDSSADSSGGLFDQAVALVARERKASTSFIQRHLQIGYNRAARIIEQMEKEGMVSKANHVGKREVLLPAPCEDTHV